jgi:Uncharacterized protein conserved in bacteria (DUF2252)
MARAPQTIEQATRSYESWLARQTHLVRADLRLKHRKMASDPFTFLRGTFYRWLQLWPSVCGGLLDAPRILAIGDVHLENFGTWRDAEGRLIWGVNDFDDACELPSAHDLVRLGTSARLAHQQNQLDVSIREVSEALLEGYRESLARDGQPIVLAERNHWLAQIAITQLHDPAEFWEQLNKLSRTSDRRPQAVLRNALPASVTDIRIARRAAGVGSLGRPRFVGLGLVGGSEVAREAKALVPSAASWLNGTSERPVDKFTLIERAVRVPDPFLSIHKQWVVRRLAPDCTKITIDQLPRKRDHRKLLRAMGWETANIHLGSAKRRTLEHDLKRRDKRWLEDAVEAMTDAVEKDWKAWVRRRG